MNNKKIIQGIVRCNKHCLNGTLFVEVESYKYDNFYKKIIKKKKIFCVDFPNRTDIKIGTKVDMISCAPVSPKKTHRICEVQHA